ncbi:glycerophosphoryl diester phosphodiesterase membrane domain-containing protein [Agromyces sp. G08B096]|uniref:Glycerophosphoryl diester phosphodiesterase membrane domain-containing protein n=1 Tax=Agromyces sp. G08B096 TaxID=3156399 RepID=A0AAU7W480_9MICO
MSDRAWQAPDGARDPMLPPAPPPPPPGWEQAPPPPPPGWQQAPAPAPQGWAPPPKPGLIPLHPLGFGTILWAPFRTLRRNPAPTFGSGLLVQLASVLLTAAVFVPLALVLAARTAQAGADDQDAVLTGSIAALLVAMLIPIAVTLVGGAFLQGVMVVEVASGTLGERLRFGALWRRAATRIWPLLGWTALVALAVGVAVGAGIAVVVTGILVGGPVGALVSVLLVILGALGVLVLWAWLGTKLALVPSVIVLEGRGIGSAVRRSWQLTDGYFWRTFGTLALVSVILSFASQVVTQPLAFIGGILGGLLDPTGSSGTAAVVLVVVYAVTLLISIVIGAITTVVQAGLVALIAIDLRMRKEGLDLDLQRHVERRDAGLPVGDPYAAPAERPTAAPVPTPPPPAAPYAGPVR